MQYTRSGSVIDYIVDKAKEDGITIRPDEIIGIVVGKLNDHDTHSLIGEVITNFGIADEIMQYDTNEHMHPFVAWTKQYVIASDLIDKRGESC